MCRWGRERALLRAERGRWGGVGLSLSVCRPPLSLPVPAPSGQRAAEILRAFPSLPLSALFFFFIPPFSFLLSAEELAAA